jgi:hypothetical protein
MRADKAMRSSLLIVASIFTLFAFASWALLLAFRLDPNSTPNGVVVIVIVIVVPIRRSTVGIPVVYLALRVCQSIGSSLQLRERLTGVVVVS